MIKGRKGLLSKEIVINKQPILSLTMEARNNRVNSSWQDVNGGEEEVSSLQAEKNIP